MKSIAIVSAGIRFPGAKTLPEFTAILEQAKDVSESIVDSRWNKRATRDPKAEGYFHNRAYSVKDWQTTAQGLELDPNLLGELDPLFHLGLGAAVDALQGARTDAVDKRRAGVILGNIALPTEVSSRLASEWLSEQWGLGATETSASAINLSPAAMPALVIAKALGLSGSTFTLDAACASSLYAVKLACDELMEGRMDFVLAGGLSRPDALYTQVGFTALDALSKSGVSYPLDSRADGLMVGEGAGIFGLKRLEDAERHGDTILAVIRGVGLSNDKEAGLMAPSGEGQWRAMQAAYVDAEWEPRSVELIECHATGTALGDATEIKSLAKIRNAAPAVIGSVKGNLGHMLTAAGSAGIAKILLSFKEKKFWPTANFREAPAAWNLKEQGLRVLKSPETWTTKQELRRAAISGFGFGGINAHILLEEYDSELSERAVRIRPRKKVAVVRAVDLEARADAYTRIEVGYKQFRIPPKEMQEILPQQIWTLLAMSTLGLPPGIDKEKMGCFVGVELDPLTNLFATRWKLQDSLPNVDLELYMPGLGANQVIGSLASIAASRCARELQLGGASFAVAAMEASGMRALEVAFRAISRGEMPAALVFATDMGTSHRGRSQRLARYGQTWQDGADESVALLLMDEQKALDAGIPVAIVLDDFAEFTADLDLPFTEGTLWLEDMNRDGNWVRDLGHTHKKIVDGNTYRGAAHGLSSLVRIWSQTGSNRGSFLLRDQKLHHVSWYQKAPLPVLSVPTVGQDSYSIARRDRTLVSPEVLFPLLSVQQASSEPGPMQVGREVTSPSKDPAPSSIPPLSLGRSPALHQLARDLIAQEMQTIEAHSQFLAYRGEGDALLAEMLQGRDLQNRTQTFPSQVDARTETAEISVGAPQTDSVPQLARQSDVKRWVREPYNQSPALFDYQACTEFAVGTITPVFGPDFSEVDTFPVRVRLPAERLLLCHRVMSLDALPKSMSSGRMVTEHDVFPDAWYLEGAYMPTSIAVESGQADLMLSSYLGADFTTRGNAVYRLLDARVCFHSALPKVGETIRYEIEIKKFFEQSGTLFFQFGFEAFIGDKPLMSMVDGCAGFFTEKALADGRGVKRSQLQLNVGQGKVVGGFQPYVPLTLERYSDEQIEALRNGDYGRAFGNEFEGLSLKTPKALPSGDMQLVYRILEIDPKGGRFECGRVIGEADIHPDDWFLTCHFVDDQVMPGTLMFECCLQTLRVFLMRAGWVGESSEQHFLPVPGIWSQLKCRGQVLATTKKVTYEIEIKEIGYGPEAYVICDALMYADGKPIVDIIDMSLRIPGHTKEHFDGFWSGRKTAAAASTAAFVKATEAVPSVSVVTAPRSVAYTYEHILAFSDGNPSDCFGPIYKPFDQDRKIARLPRPPFQFLDSVETVDGPFMKQNVGTRLISHYEMPDDAWYWACHNDRLPFSVLVEIALQPCGFMAGYMGSALCSPTDLKFRNLSGEAELLQDIRRGSGRLSVEVVSTKIARSGDMIIQDYSFRVFNELGDVYVGTTSFGFFTEDALAQQAGIRGEGNWKDVPIVTPYPHAKALPQGRLRMVDRWEAAGDLIYGAKAVDPKEWFFEAHFFEDPVMPGSLGLEALLQTLEAEAYSRCPSAPAWRVALKSKHNWMYRGQVRKHNKEVHLKLSVKERSIADLTVDSVLYCDGIAIYKLDNLRIEAATP